MIETRATCPDCGGEATIGTGDSAHSGRLRVYESHFCADCGYALEADGPGPLPEETRRRVLSEHGVFGLQVRVKRSQDRIVLMKVLREALGLSLPEAKRLVSRLPGVVVRGTRAEVRALAARVEEAGLAGSERGLDGPEADPRSLWEALGD